jgi:hypothetical protein
MFTIALTIYGVVTLAIVLGLCFAAGRPMPSMNESAAPKTPVLDSPKVRARAGRRTLTKRFAYGA